MTHCCRFLTQRPTTLTITTGPTTCVCYRSLELVRSRSSHLEVEGAVATPLTDLTFRDPCLAEAIRLSNKSARQEFSNAADGTAPVSKKMAATQFARAPDLISVPLLDNFGGEWGIICTRSLLENCIGKARRRTNDL